jgi:H+-translocating NAD(P) transhydrogenase subunit alpha
MRLAVPRESAGGERRLALVPESVKKLVKAGVSVRVEAGAGAGAFVTDAELQAAGAEVVANPALLFEVELILRVQPPPMADVDRMRPGTMLLTTLTPTRQLDLVRRLATRQVTAFSIDQIPRITRAQAMDTLSSMSSLAGYKAVLIAANELGKYFPMLMTAAGMILPARVFVIGAGVAGLQAIATARRLGAAVEATDTRPAVKTEIESLGAKYVGVTSDEEAQDSGGYAKELSQDFYRRQAALIAERCVAADVVITTALIGGVTAPRLISADIVAHMRTGSVIVDLAAVAGGNCECTVPGETVRQNGVTICGPLNLPSEMAVHGSLLYSRNLTAFVLAFWKEGAFHFDLADDILKACTITHQGAVIHEPTARLLEQQEGGRQ